MNPKIFWLCLVLFAFLACSVTRVIPTRTGREPIPASASASSIVDLPPMASLPSVEVATVSIKTKNPESLDKLLLDLSQTKKLKSEYQTALKSFQGHETNGQGYVIALADNFGPWVVTRAQYFNQNPTAQVTFSSNTELMAKLVYLDREADLAILELPESKSGLSFSRAYEAG